jgi:hypothetical protein
VLQEDWAQRFEAIQLLTHSGRQFEGIAEFVPTLCRWLFDVLGALPRPPSADLSSFADVQEQRVTLRRRALEIQHFVLTVCDQNASAMSENDQKCVIAVSLKVFEEAVGDAPVAQKQGIRESTR